MKKIFSLLLMALLLQNMLGQDFTGIQSSRFFPLQNINNQPADLVRNNSRWNINLVSAQIGLINNVVFNESDFLKQLSKFGYTDLKHFLASDQSVLLARGKVFLPSVSYKINTNHAVAFSLNLRADGMYRSSNDELTQLFTGYDNPELLEDLNNEYFKSVVNQWMEYSFTWSGVLLNRNEHLLTGGANVKYLVGGSSGYFDLDGIKVMYDKEKIEYFQADVSYAYNKNLNEAFEEGKIDLFGDKGLGLDLGLSYSYKPDGAEDIPYRFKVGLVVNDIGYVKNSSEVNRSTFSVSITDVPYSRFNGIESLEALTDSLQKSVGVSVIEHESYKMNLPTAVIISGDYSFNSNWYLSGFVGLQPGFYRQLLDIVEKNIFNVNLTPRFENKTWGGYLPITYNNRLNFSTGLAFRWKYVFVGSGSIISNMFKSEKDMGEFYFGINIPIGKVE